MLCHVPSIGSCSQFCLILQPHRVPVPFPPTFASPWRNNFVQIHGGTTLLKAKFGITPQKRQKNDINWGVGSSYGKNKPPLPNPSFTYNINISSRPYTSPAPTRTIWTLSTCQLHLTMRRMRHHGNRACHQEKCDRN